MHKVLQLKKMCLILNIIPIFVSYKLVIFLHEHENIFFNVIDNNILKTNMRTRINSFHS